VGLSADAHAQTRSVLDQLAARQTWRLRHILAIALAVAFLAWCADGVNLRPRELTNALRNAEPADAIREVVTGDASFLSECVAMLDREIRRSDRKPSVEGA